MPRCVKCARILPTADLTRKQQPKGEWTCKDAGPCAEIRRVALELNAALADNRWIPALGHICRLRPGDLA